MTPRRSGPNAAYMEPSVLCALPVRVYRSWSEIKHAARTESESARAVQYLFCAGYFGIPQEISSARSLALPKAIKFSLPCCRPAPSA